MVTKKTTRRAAPRRAAPARRAPARRRRAKSGVPMIPSAMASAALVAVNAKPVVNLWKSATARGYDLGTIKNRFQTSGDTKAALNAVIGKNALIKDVAAVAGGYVAGELVKKYAPASIKATLGKISKKIPKVI